MKTTEIRAAYFKKYLEDKGISTEVNSFAARFPIASDAEYIKNVWPKSPTYTIYDVENILHTIELDYYEFVVKHAEHLKSL